MQRRWVKNKKWIIRDEKRFSQEYFKLILQNRPIEYCDECTNMLVVCGKCFNEIYCPLCSECNLCDRKEAK